MPTHISLLSILSPALLATCALLAGCATLTGEPNQAIQIRTLDASDKPISGLRCHAVNASSDYYGTSPMIDLQVRRSSSDLQIECSGHGMVARGTAISRGNAAAVAAAILPGGTASMVIDYVSGYSFTYPAWIQLRVGQDLVFDAYNDVAGQPTKSVQANHP